MTTYTFDKSNQTYQFLIITYNQENVILNHLESIKYQILTYGSGRDILLSVFDDCSNDLNVNIINDFVFNNSSLFTQVEIVVNDVNIGIKENYLKAIENIVTSKFKLLAGDDTYIKSSNIFDYMDFCSQREIVLSPVLINGVFKFSQKLYTGKLMYLSRRPNYIKELIENCVYFINAPGAHISLQILKDPDYRLYLKNSELSFEDWPSWEYLFFKNKNVFSVFEYPVVDYIKSQSKPFFKNSHRRTLLYNLFRVIKGLKLRLSIPHGVILLTSEIYAFFYLGAKHFKIRIVERP